MSRRRIDPMQQVGDGIARAFLDGAWEPASMAERAHSVLGDDRKWIDRLARMIARSFDHRPADARRKLVELILASPDLIERRDKDDDKGRPAWTVSSAPLVPIQMGPRRWDVAEINDVGTLAATLGLQPTHLAWYADVRSLERSARDEALRHYTYRWVPKATGGARLIEAPKPMLRMFQRRVLHEIVDLIPPHDAAHGFRRGHSIHSFVAPHVGQAVVMRIDLDSFFPSVRAARVFGIFRMAGYPEPVAHVLTGLVTNVAPDHVLRAARVPGRPVAASTSASLPYYRTPHLPQGAPTSPSLANLSAFGLDRRLAGLASSMGLAYTRYADDLAFSGDAQLARSVPRFVELVRTIAQDEGFRLNPTKTRVRRACSRQHLGGLVVNERPNVTRSDYDLLKATIHDAVVHGPEHANRHQVGDFKAHLLGRIGWVAASNPHRGEKLQRLADDITW